MLLNSEEYLAKVVAVLLALGGEPQSAVVLYAEECCSEGCAVGEGVGVLLALTVEQRVVLSLNLCTAACHKAVVSRHKFGVEDCQDLFGSILLACQ